MLVIVFQPSPFFKKTLGQKPSCFFPRDGVTLMKS